MLCYIQTDMYMSLHTSYAGVIYNTHIYVRNSGAAHQVAVGTHSSYPTNTSPRAFYGAVAVTWLPLGESLVRSSRGISLHRPSIVCTECKPPKEHKPSDTDH